MDFHENKPIYLQIVDWMYDKIARGQWGEQARIPSVRELGMLLKVNHNTVMRAYEKLQSQQVIHNERGIGYFVSPGAVAAIRQMRREYFYREELPALFEKIGLLGIPMAEIAEKYETYKTEANENEQ